MINHENRIIELGHGDVCVGRNFTGLHFQNIRPPQEVGTYLFRGQDNLEFFGDIVELHIPDIKEISEFECQLQKVESGEKDSIAYGACGKAELWIIKFNGNKKSVEVVRAHFDGYKRYVISLLAC